MSNATTLDDIAESITDLTTLMAMELANVRHEVKTGLNEVRQEMASGLNEVRQEMAASFAEVRQEMASGFAEVRQEMATSQDMQEVKSELRQINKRLENIEGKVEAHEQDIRELYFMVQEEPLNGSGKSKPKPKLLP